MGSIIGRSPGVAHHGSLEAMQEYVANADSNIWRSCNKEIERVSQGRAEEGQMESRSQEAECLQVGGDGKEGRTTVEDGQWKSMGSYIPSPSRMKSSWSSWMSLL